MPSLILAAAMLLQSPGVPAEAPEVRGTAGVCIRWADDPDHVADAVVVVPSGNDALDQALPASVKTMRWPRPTGDKGEWMGITIAVGEGPASQTLPSCNQLPRPKTLAAPPAGDDAPSTT
jgi:hypothetical protein